MSDPGWWRVHLLLTCLAAPLPIHPPPAAALEPAPAARATCDQDHGGTCLVLRHHSLPAGTILDYGDRRVVIRSVLSLSSGHGPGSLALRTTGDLELARDGRLDVRADGPRGSDGGALTLTVGGTATLEGQIDLDGETRRGSGGHLTLTTGGALTLSAAARITADGASGGTVELTAGGAITVAGDITAQGDSSLGQGGTIRLASAGETSVTRQAHLRVDGARPGSLAARAGGSLGWDGELSAEGAPAPPEPSWRPSAVRPHRWPAASRREVRTERTAAPSRCRVAAH